MLPLIRSLIPQPIKKAAKKILFREPRELREPFGPLTKNLLYKGPKHLTSEQWHSWNEKGYLILPQVFSEGWLKSINELVDQLWRSRHRADNRLVIDAYIGTPQEQRIYFREAPDEARLVPYKLNDLFLESHLIRDTILDPLLSAFLADLLEGDPLACNSLTFERSSQQRFHFDTFYMPPPVQNKMVASWIALEDTDPAAGPLAYYPGSHKIPPYFFSDGRLNQNLAEMPEFDQYIESEIAKRALKPETFLPKAGDVLIWHAQLYHAGKAIENMALTRKSLVTHYFRAIDFPRSCCHTVAPGRHYMKRDHQRVTTSN